MRCTKRLGSLAATGAVVSTRISQHEMLAVGSIMGDVHMHNIAKGAVMDATCLPMRSTLFWL